MLKIDNQKWSMEPIFKGGADSKELQTFLDEISNHISLILLKLQQMRAPHIEGDEIRLVKMIRSIGDLKAKAREAAAFSLCLLRESSPDKKVQDLRMICSQLLESINPLLFEIDRLLLETPGKLLDRIIRDEQIGTAAFFVRERIKLAEHRLAPELENMVQTLGKSSQMSWSRLRMKMIDNVNLSIEMDGKLKTVPGRKALHMMFTSHPDKNVRKALHIQFEEAVKPNAELFCHALNQIIETNLKIQNYRGYKHPLTQTLQENRLSEASLNAMGEVLEKNLSRFTPYFKRKAKLLGMEKLGEEDLLASLAGSSSEISYEDGLQSIMDIFGEFSPAMAKFVLQATGHQWMDVEDREDKSFIQFNTYLPVSKQPRVMTRYQGSFQSVAILAHELGHSYHFHQLAENSSLVQDIPLSMSEIASTFSELLVTNGYLKRIENTEEKIMILDEKIKNIILFIFKPYINFIFLKKVYEECASHSVSAIQLNELMIKAQKFVYQDELGTYTPTEWISNNLFWLIDRPFYNYQYSFGYLFSAGLNALVENGEFSSDAYASLLQDTGCMSVEEMAFKHLNVDLSLTVFWQKSLDLLIDDVEQFLSLTDVKANLQSRLN